MLGTRQGAFTADLEVALDRLSKNKDAELHDI